MEFTELQAMYPVLVTAAAIGFTVQYAKDLIAAYFGGMTAARKRFVFRSVAYELGLVAGVVPGWMPTIRADGAWFESIVLGLCAAIISDLAYRGLRRKFTSLSSNGGADA